MLGAIFCEELPQTEAGYARGYLLAAGYAWGYLLAALLGAISWQSRSGHHSDSLC